MPKKLAIGDLKNSWC